jgi:hypothetical protein
MVSNVSLYAFVPGRDEYTAYDSSAEGRRAVVGTHRERNGGLAGQIPFEAPWTSIPGPLSGYALISFEELELEMERNARRQEH